MKARRMLENTMATFGLLLAMLAISAYLRHLAKAATPSGKWLRQSVGGSPRWTWCLSAWFQCLVFPALVLGSFASFASKGGSLHDWLFAAPWDTASEVDSSTTNWGDLSMWFHHVMLAYFLKDAFIPMVTLIIVHHVVCGLFVALSLAGYLQGSHNAFVVCTLLLEFGSAAMVFEHIKVKGKGKGGAEDDIKDETIIFSTLTTVLMSLSNASAMAVTVYWVATCEATPIAIRGVFLIVGGAVAAIREKEALDRWARVPQAETKAE